jgi:hypothetical protein
MPNAHLWCQCCGDAARERNHAACLRALKLEPPRYCALCRRRMVVQVTPGAWTAKCVEHGEISGFSAVTA